jgi:hypothetical protein
VRVRGGRGRRLWPAVAAAALIALLSVSSGSSAAPRFVLVFGLARPHASVARARALARSLGLDGLVVRRTPSSYVVTDRSGERQLVLYKASGGFDYVNRRTYRRPPRRPLPTHVQARRHALLFLRAHRLLPAQDARFEVRPDSASRPTALVVTVTPLAAGAPVRDGSITFWLAGGGAIARLRDEYRPPSTTAIRVVSRSPAEVLADIRADLGATAGIRLRLAYAAQPPYLPQAYLDPVYEGVAHGFVLDRVPATTFTLRATITAPNPNVPIAARATVHLRASAADGKRPYAFIWSGNRSGFLGKGRALDVPLEAGDTEIQLTVRDSSGAVMTYAMPIRVVGPTTGGTAAPARENRTYGDGTISFRVDQDGTHPLSFRNVEAAGVRRLSDVYFGQFRYTALVRYQGSDYHITSAKCVPLTVAGDACALPESPYAQSAGASAPAAGASGARVESTVTVANLPGRLRLVVEGSGENAYCGQSGELGAVGLELLPKYVDGASGRVGGDCPGFRPSVEWSYQPPAVFRPSDFAHLCLQNAGLCDVPHSLLSQWSTGAFDAGPQPEIADFRLSVYTALLGAPGPEQVALARESSSPLRLAASDGAVDPSCRPRAIRAAGQLRDNDAFTCIAPLAVERSAVLAVPDGRGAWDNLHLKSEAPAPNGISFPGCNHPLKGYDIPSCIHLHEHWGDAIEPASRGQEVTVFVVRRKASEASPGSVESLANGEPLRHDTAHGYDLVLWHRSTASSTQCYPAGGVDNTRRPCLVFPTALFFTPR